MEDSDSSTSCDKKPCAAKLSRKIGEKLRRDRLNSLITQLAEEIPIIRYAHKRLDKTAILRLTVSFMELHHGLKRKRLCNNKGVSGLCLFDWLKKVTDDSVMILSHSGTILYISPKITDHIGFYQTDMLGHNIEQFIHRNDLLPLMSLFSSDKTHESGVNYATFKQTSNNGMAQLENFHDENSLYIRLLKATRRKRTAADTREYETFNIHCRCENTSNLSNKATNSEQWMVTMLKPVCKEPLREIEVQISEFTRNNEWASMHSLDGKILAQDHRCALFHGRMPSESTGRTPYGLIHKEDLGMVALSHRNIMTNHETNTVFRMTTAMNEVLYVQARSIIVKESWTKAPKCIVSVNAILDLEKGMHLLSLQKEACQKLLAETKCKDKPRSQSETNEINNDSSESENTCDSSDLDNKSCSGENNKKDLTEIYETEAKSYPALYSSQENCSQTSSARSQSEKRSFQDVDSDSSESYANRHTDSSTCENKNGYNNTNGTHMSDKNPVLKSLLNSKKRVISENNASESNGTATHSEISEKNDSDKAKSLPLLKGLLEGRPQSERSSYISVPRPSKPRDNSLSSEDYNICGLTNGSTCDNKNVHFGQELTFRSHQSDDGGSSSYCLGSEASSIGVQSPTIGSSEGCSANTELDVMLYNKFTQQLESKHTMLKRTISSQRNTLEILREQIQKSHNNVQLRAGDEYIHDTLLERLTEAEAQVEVQGQLLGELEREVKTQKQTAQNV